METVRLSVLNMQNNDLFVCTFGDPGGVSLCVCVCQCQSVCVCVFWSWCLSNLVCSAQGCSLSLTVSWWSSGVVLGFIMLFMLFSLSSRRWLLLCLWVCAFYSDVSTLWWEALWDMLNPCRATSKSPPLSAVPFSQLFSFHFLFTSNTEVAMSRIQTSVFWRGFPLSLVFPLAPMACVLPPVTYCDTSCQRQMTLAWHVYVCLWMCRPGRSRQVCL